VCRSVSARPPCTLIEWPVRAGLTGRSPKSEKNYGKNRIRTYLLVPARNHRRIAKGKAAEQGPFSGPSKSRPATLSALPWINSTELAPGTGTGVVFMKGVGLTFSRTLLASLCSVFHAGASARSGTEGKMFRFRFPLRVPSPVGTLLDCLFFGHVFAPVCVCTTREPAFPYLPLPFT